MLNPYGPTMTPVRMYATRGGTFILVKIIPTIRAYGKNDQDIRKKFKNHGNTCTESFNGKYKKSFAG